MSRSAACWSAALIAALFSALAPAAISKTAGTGSMALQTRVYRGALKCEFWEMKYEGDKKGTAKCGPSKDMNVEIIFHPGGSITGSAERFMAELNEDAGGKGVCEYVSRGGLVQISGEAKPDGSFRFTVNGDDFEGTLDEGGLYLAKEFKGSTRIISDFLMGKIHHRYKLAVKAVRVAE